MLDLFQKYLQNDISREELRELAAYFAQPENRLQVMELIQSALADGSASTNQVEQLLAGLDDQVLGRVKALAEAEERKLQTKRWRIRYWPAAAVLVMATAIGAFFYLHVADNSSKLTAHAPLTDIAPGGNRAILTLEDGVPIELDSTQLGVQIGDGAVRYTGGQLVAELGATAAEQLSYARLTTPKGGQYQVTLQDGTTVWLNAASSIRYPAQFSGDVREVELDGEAYFEVAPDRTRPFVVKSRGQAVEVLGTKFNINAYTNEEVLATTLVEGAVRVTGTANQQKPQVLKPGQQAVVRGGHIEVKDVNVSYYTGWKDGMFAFDRVALSVVLRQIERWYDVSFEYDETISDIPLWGTLSRGVLLSELLQALEVNTGYHFEREGRRIVMSQ